MMADTLSYDLNYLKEISNNDDDFLKDMVQTFISTTPESINEMKLQLANEDFHSLGKTAHKLIPSVQFIGVQQIVDDLDALENYVLNGTHLDSVPALLHRIENACNQIILLLKKDFDM